jgi:hypothetical protein
MVDKTHHAVSKKKKNQTEKKKQIQNAVAMGNAQKARVQERVVRAKG